MTLQSNEIASGHSHGGERKRFLMTYHREMSLMSSKAHF
jgi:hypothetical protein